MRKIAFLAAFLAAFAAAPARAQFSLSVSDETIRVTTGFVGTSLTVFGTQDLQGSVVIVVEGPPKTITVRKKDRVLGLWTNTDSRRFVSVPAYYAIAASTPLDRIAAPDVLQNNRIGLGGLMTATRKNNDGTAVFAKALIEMQEEKKLYAHDVQQLEYPGPTLFKARFGLPAIVPPGTYKASAYLFSEGQVIDQDSIAFTVVPEGLNAELRHFATEDGLLYGLAGVLMAMIAGWLATVLLKRE